MSTEEEKYMQFSKNASTIAKKTLSMFDNIDHLTKIAGLTCALACLIVKNIPSKEFAQHVELLRHTIDTMKEQGFEEHCYGR